MDVTVKHWIFSMLTIELLEFIMGSNSIFVMEA
jgi:hypothetical protein